jgi:hypothetical protein
MMNGMALHGVNHPYGGTFMVFRTTAAGHPPGPDVRAIHVLTHDSISAQARTARPTSRSNICRPGANPPNPLVFFRPKTRLRPWRLRPPLEPQASRSAMALSRQKTRPCALLRRRHPFGERFP